MTKLRIPKIGLGLYQMSAEDMATILPKAIELGYRHLDGAAVYGNQEAMGKVLQELFQQNKVKRSDLFITDKLWDTQHGCVEKACRESLAKCRLEYFDLYLIHWPFSMKPSKADPMSAERQNGVAVIDPSIKLADVWRDMERLVDLGLVKNIGVSNFLKSQIEEILSAARIKPAVQQIEVHPLLPQREMIEFCEAHGIQVEAYAPLGGGKLISNAVVQSIANEVGATPSQVLLSFALKRGLVALVKTCRVERLAENLKQTDLSDAHIRQLMALESGERFFDPKSWYGIDLF